MDRRPRVLGTPGRCGTGSARAIRPTGGTGAIHDADHFGASHHRTRRSDDDYHDHHDASADDHHLAARGHIGGDLTPLGRARVPGNSTLRRMEFSLEDYQIGLRPGTVAPKMTAKTMAGAR